MTSSPLTVVLAVFTAMAEWFATALPTVISLFYAEGALTFLGVLAVAGLAVSVVFLPREQEKSFLGEFNEGKGPRFLCPQLLLLLKTIFPAHGRNQQLPPLQRLIIPLTPSHRTYTVNLAV